MVRWFFLLTALLCSSVQAQSVHQIPNLGGVEAECNILLHPKLQESFRNFRMGAWEFHPKENHRGILATPVAASVDGYSYFSVLAFCWLTKNASGTYSIDFTRPGVYGYEVD